MKRITIAAVAAAFFVAGCQTADKPLTAQGLFDRHIEASYGSAGLDGIQSTELTGEIVIAQFGLRAPMTLRAMAPGSASTKSQIMGTTVTSGCHEGRCWDQPPGGALTDLTGDRLDAALQQADYYQLTRMADYYETLVMDPVEEGATTRSVTATKANGDVDSYVFDIETGLMASSTTQTLTPQGKFAVVATFGDYQEFEGIQVATKVEQALPIATFTIEIKEVAINSLTADDFARP